MRAVVPASWVLLAACDPGGDSPVRTRGVVVTPPVVAPPVLTVADTGGADPTEYEMLGFSFVDEVAAGMPQPGLRAPLEDDLGYIALQGVVLLVSLTIEPVSADAAADHGLDHLHLPIQDMTPPTYDQQVAFVDEMLRRAEAGDPVGVHCTAGLGRTGTMLATWFVAKGMDAETAIATIRELRPGSIETLEQEDAVRTFAATWGG